MISAGQSSRAIDTNAASAAAAVASAAAVVDVVAISKMTSIDKIASQISRAMHLDLLFLSFDDHSH